MAATRALRDQVAFQAEAAAGAPSFVSWDGFATALGVTITTIAECFGSCCPRHLPRCSPQNADSELNPCSPRCWKAAGGHSLENWVVLAPTTNTTDGAATVGWGYFGGEHGRGVEGGPLAAEPTIGCDEAVGKV